MYELTPRHAARISRRGFRVYLELLDASDALDLYRYSQDPAIHRFMPWGAHSCIEETRALIAQTQSNTDMDASVDYGIHDVRDHMLVGVISLADINRRYRSAELGYWLGQEHWGKGLMYEAQVLLIRHAFDELDLHRLQARVSPRNEASRKSLQRVGFSLDGVLRDDSYWKGRYHTHQLFSLLADDPQPAMPHPKH